MKNVSTYQDNIVDILYAIIDPDPTASIRNIDERIKHSDRRFAGGIPLIAYGRQS
ncbi:hypothetical protein KC711_05525 [Candidatus Peregrinibacteria bacterium]|nr:hypothetical protein [Candidatus Peregrinibacteria bacterium]MCB9804057.1 hypothetical protein [Candidatus Peribacteria bacterium]